jgi:hypothetical protein
VGSTWVINQGTYTYTTIPYEFLGTVTPIYTKDAYYNNVTIQFHKPTEVLAWQNGWNFSQPVEDELLTHGFASSSYYIKMNYSGEFNTYSRTYNAGESVTFSTLGRHASGRAAFTFLALREIPYEASWTRLAVYYNFSTGTYEEQVTKNATYTLVSKPGTENYSHSIATHDDGARWLSVSKRAYLTAPIGPLVTTTQNFTFMLHYDFQSTYPMNFGSDLMNRPSGYEGVILSSYNLNSGAGHVRWKIHPDPTTQGYATYDNTSQSQTLTTVVQNFNQNLPYEGTLPDINNWRGKHVWVGVCNFNQTTGTDLASAPGTISFYLDNRLIKSTSFSANHINPLDYAAHVFELFSNSDGGPVYFQSFKIYDGVVDMQMLNQLSTL